MRVEEGSLTSLTEFQHLPSLRLYVLVKYGPRHLTERSKAQIRAVLGSLPLLSVAVPSDAIESFGASTEESLRLATAEHSPLAAM